MVALMGLSGSGERGLEHPTKLRVYGVTSVVVTLCTTCGLLPLRASIVYLMPSGNKTSVHLCAGLELPHVGFSRRTCSRIVLLG